MMMLGGLLFVGGGIAILVWGDRIRERAARDGRAFATPERHRRQAWVLIALGLGQIALANLF